MKKVILIAVIFFNVNVLAKVPCTAINIRKIEFFKALVNSQKFIEKDFVSLIAIEENQNTCHSYQAIVNDELGGVCHYSITRRSDGPGYLVKREA